VHCRQGIGRSGLIAIGALMSSGFATEEAIRAVSLARGLPIPETPAQHEWLRHLPAGHPAEKFSD
jgi:protein-tyrosine phosphatase